MPPRDTTRTHDSTARWAELAERVARAPDPLEVIRADQVARRVAHDPVRAEEYLAHFPRLSPDDQLALVVAEIGLRYEHGETFDLAEYQARFPAMAGDLAITFQLLAALTMSSRTGTVTRSADAAAESPVRADLLPPVIPGFV